MAKPIAEARGEPLIFAPSNKWVASFFSSPYYPHLASRAVDVSTSTEFGDDALSPVEGVIEKIVEVDAGPGPFSRKDYVIVVRMGVLRAKLMHVEPRVKVNERIFVGDSIGKYLRSNYLEPKNLPHIHVEICRGRSLRPSTSLPLEPSRELIEDLRKENLDAKRSSYARFKVVSVGDSYTLLRPVDSRATCVTGSCRGIEVVVNGDVFEGHSYVGAIHLGAKPKPNSLLRAFGTPLGYVKKVRERHSIAINSLKSFRDWILEMGSISSLSPSPRFSSPKLLVKAFANGTPSSLELLIGSYACAKVGSRIEDSYVDVVLSIQNT